MGHVAGTKRCKDAMKLRAFGCVAYPCNIIKSRTNQRQRPEYAKSELKKKHMRVSGQKRALKKNTVEFK